MNEVYNEILNNFAIYDEYTKYLKGPLWLLKDGRFLVPDRAHGEVDEFVLDYLGIDLTDDDVELPWESMSGYLMDMGAIRLNDGLRGFRGDRYIELPITKITATQRDALECWLNNLSPKEIDISCNEKYVTYDMMFYPVEYILDAIDVFYARGSFVQPR